MKTTRKHFITALGGALLAPSFISELPEIIEKDHYVVKFNDTNDNEFYAFNIKCSTELSAKQHFTNAIKTLHFTKNPSLRKRVKVISLCHISNNKTQLIRKAFVDEKTITEYDLDLGSVTLLQS